MDKGFGLIFSAVYKLRAYGEVRTMMPSGAEFMGPLSRFAIGMMLIFLPNVIDSFLMTVWGTSSVVSISSVSLGDLDKWPEAKRAILGFVQLFGYVAIVRGLILLNRAATKGAQPGTMGKGLTHLIGGVLAVNIGGTINVLKATLGV